MTLSEKVMGDALLALADIFQQDNANLSKSKMSGYYAALSDLSDALFIAAITKVLKKERFFPVPATILGYAHEANMEQIEAEREERARLPPPPFVPPRFDVNAAWDEVAEGEISENINTGEVDRWIRKLAGKNADLVMERLEEAREKARRKRDENDG